MRKKKRKKLDPKRREWEKEAAKLVVDNIAEAKERLGDDFKFPESLTGKARQMLNLEEYLCSLSDERVTTYELVERFNELSLIDVEYIVSREIEMKRINSRYDETTGEIIVE
ncbi:MAG: hypothetical protein GPJ51_07025 [Candidatus Heimdallarchaeota archaeon]|nr:hypothetical protein [Candidatus Heimdallarchaeota archaeon]